MTAPSTRRKLLLATTALIAASHAIGARAHHSFGSIYDQSKDQRLSGVVKEFRFVHPHPILVFEVTAPGGARTVWRAEMDNRYELEDIGITATTFLPGDEVIVNGSPGRSQQSILYLWKLLRPSDGLRYEQVGSSPYVYPGRPAPG